MIRALRDWADREPEFAGLIAGLTGAVAVFVLAFFLLSWVIS